MLGSGVKTRFRLDNASQFRPDEIIQLAKRYWGSSELKDDASNFQKRNFKTARSMVRFQIVNGQKSLVISASPSVFLAGSIHPYNTFHVFEEIN